MKNTTSHRVTNENALAFILGGKARFTLKSLKTEVEFSYSICNAPIRKYGKFGPKIGENPDMKFVALFIGSNKEVKGDYAYAGEVRKVKNGWVFNWGLKSKLDQNNPGIKAFSFVFTRLMQGVALPTLEVWHEGVCCCCGKKLVKSASIELGWGPVCLGKREEMLKRLEAEIAIRRSEAVTVLNANPIRPDKEKMVKQVLGGLQTNLFSNVPDYQPIKNR